MEVDVRDKGHDLVCKSVVNYPRPNWLGIGLKCSWVRSPVPYSRLFWSGAPRAEYINYDSRADQGNTCSALCFSVSGIMHRAVGFSYVQSL
jgi:hypothetical protein